MSDYVESSIWHPDAYQALLDNKVEQARYIYEKLIESEPDEHTHYWFLGLLYLIEGQEGDAQTTWFMVLSSATDETEGQWLGELLLILDEEAGRQQTLDAHNVALGIRQYIREFDPSNLNNVLLLLQLSIQLEQLSLDDLNNWNILNLLQQRPRLLVHRPLLSTVIGQLLQIAAWESVVFDVVQASVSFFTDSPQLLIDVLIGQSNRIGHGEKTPRHGARLLELALELDSENFDVLKHLSVFYQDSQQHEKGIEIGYHLYDLATNLIDKIVASSILLRGVLTVGGKWQAVTDTFQKQLNLFQQFIDQQEQIGKKTTELSLKDARYMFNAGFFQPYLRDDLARNRYYQNKLASMSQVNVHHHESGLVEKFSQRNRRSLTATSRLKIGYVSACLRQHSVGWLARWLYKHHDRDRFQIHSYLVSYRFHGEDELRDWYVEQSDVVHKLDANAATIANQIFEDDIDILVDLDSVTLDTTCTVMALKPAPVQVSWLGWDAPGIPTVDYFIVDNYVLPKGAEEHYTEKLWRLPETYIAVDGFEVGIPSLHRSDLDIPIDAVVYLSAQRGHKRYPPFTHLQMQILKAVPNSYFLVKSLKNDDSLETLFRKVAKEEGIEGDRLRFLPDVPSEKEHRANLTIADVVLDTYPYSGATTTLETLWMGIPLVTRVGSTFSSRNSYTMMVNAGLSEGIAWTDEEYVAWGVRLGTDKRLRQHVTEKLRQSRQTSALWNGKKFTKEMEKAYQQMWSAYVESKR